MLKLVPVFCPRCRRIMGWLFKGLGIEYAVISEGHGVHITFVARVELRKKKLSHKDKLKLGLLKEGVQYIY